MISAMIYDTGFYIMLHHSVANALFSGHFELLIAVTHKLIDEQSKNSTEMFM